MTVNAPAGVTAEARTELIDTAFYVAGERSAPGINVVPRFTPEAAGSYAVHAELGGVSNEVELVVQHDRRGVAPTRLPFRCDVFEPLTAGLVRCNQQILRESGESLLVVPAASILRTTEDYVWVVESGRISAWSVTQSGSLQPLGDLPVALGNAPIVTRGQKLFAVQGETVVAFEAATPPQSLGEVHRLPAGTQTSQIAATGTRLVAATTANGTRSVCSWRWGAETAEFCTPLDAPDRIAADQSGLWVVRADRLEFVGGERSEASSRQNLPASRGASFVAAAEGLSSVTQKGRHVWVARAALTGIIIDVYGVTILPVVDPAATARGNERAYWFTRSQPSEETEYVRSE